MERRSWADMGPGRRASMVVMAVVQMVLAVTAWADLARRADDEVRGRKAVWAAVIAISYVGPIAYFARGRVRH